MRIFIITPTIGRNSLKRCISSVKDQIIIQSTHIVVGDGPQNSWVKDYCENNQTIYYELETHHGKFGTMARNYALDRLFKEFNLSKQDYIMFLDDDNELLMNCLYNISDTIEKNNFPSIIIQSILYTGKFNTNYFVMPINDNSIPSNSDWDNLNGIFRSDIIKNVRFTTVYNHDYILALETFSKVKPEEICKVKGVNAIHHVSWDTYDAVYKQL